jgi:putative peptidoglycan lipid II flippase
VHTIVTVLTIAAPLVIIMIWQAPLIVKLLFERGEFHAADTAQVAHVLRYAALQIPFYITSLLMSRVVVSLQANSFTLVVTSIALINNIVFNRLLMVRYGAAGIALSTAVVYLMSCVVMFLFLDRRLRKLVNTEAA